MQQLGVIQSTSFSGTKALFWQFCKATGLVVMSAHVVHAPYLENQMNYQIEGRESAGADTDPDKRRTPTRRAPGPDTESAGPRHRERRAPTQRAPGPDTEIAGARHRERRRRGPKTERWGP